MSDPKKANYPKDPYIICKDRTVLSCGRMPKVVDVPCEHVGACIVAGVFTLLPGRLLGHALWRQLGLI